MSETGKVINSIEPILELIRGNNLKSAVENILIWVDPQIADLLIQLDKAEQILVFRALPRQRAADVFSYLEPQDQDSLLALVRGHERFKQYFTAKTIRRVIMVPQKLINIVLT